MKNKELRQLNYIDTGSINNNRRRKSRVNSWGYKGIYGTLSSLCLCDHIIPVENGGAFQGYY